MEQIREERVNGTHGWWRGRPLLWLAVVGLVGVGAVIVASNRSTASRQATNQFQDEWASLADRVRDMQAAGATSRALPLAKQAYQIAVRGYGPDHPATAESANALGLLLMEMSQFAAAEKCFQEAAAIFASRLGPDSADVAVTLGNYAQLLEKTCRYQEAEATLRRVIESQQKTNAEGGRDDASLAQAMTNLAIVRDTLGDRFEARALHEEALDIREQATGPASLATAESLGNVSMCFFHSDDLDKAEDLQRRSLAIRRHALGESHPVTATSLANLSIILREKKDFAAAEESGLGALAIREIKLGPDHPGTAQALENLGLIATVRGDTRAAARYLGRSLGIRAQRLGPDHPKTARSLYLIAAHAIDGGDYRDAEKPAARALAARMKHFGAAHPDTQASERQLAVIREKLTVEATAEPDSPGAGRR